MISVSPGHCLYKAGRTGFKMSPLLQYRAALVGAELPFDAAANIYNNLIMNKLSELSDKQIERICHTHGESVGIEIECQTAEQPFESKTELTYVMVDGSMVLSREDKWREVKLGRIFQASDRVEIKKRAEIRDSHYVAHLGHCSDFCAKLEPALDGFRHLVAIADGAQWIWDYFSTSYPDAIQILDFFHAKERLSTFGKSYFKTTEEQAAWLEKQETLLFEDKIEYIIAQISALECSGPTKKVQADTITYLSHNQCRMYYQTYQDKGYLIGSGAIESAHRHVLQQRFKLSGQRWSLKGFEQICNLRVTLKNKQEHILKKVIYAAA
jgi:hypothetical protein